MDDVNDQLKSHIIRLWENGLTMAEIEALTLVPQSTIKDVILAWG